jgi:hypothetical protein
MVVLTGIATSETTIIEFFRKMENAGAAWEHFVTLGIGFSLEVRSESFSRQVLPISR